MIYFCCDQRRRNAVASHPTLNGLDFLEVSDNPADPAPDRQRTLFVHFVKPLTIPLTEENFVIEGGERIREIKVIRISGAGLNSPPSPPSSPPADPTLVVVEVSTAGDFSTYTLRVVADADQVYPPSGIDPILASIEFSFKVLCPSDFDCKVERVCPDEPPVEPEINYLAKDYATFRQLIFDRMAVLSPQWAERNPADIGVALVELLAYVGDYLSYQQDEVATESYLGTARRRASIRRHARLVDYAMHDGRNARTWVHVVASASGNGLTIEKGSGRSTTKFLTHAPGLPDMTLIPQPSSELDDALARRPRVFQPMHPITLFEAHNQMKFYTWGARACCLPKGSTRASLDGAFPDLEAGDVLILAEKRGPQTGETEDADRSHRHAIRLKEVAITSDPLGGQFKTPPDNSASPVTEIAWDRSDALPFALCVSSRVASRGDVVFFDDCGVALGNILLVDHGMTLTDEPENFSGDVRSLVTALDPPAAPAPDSALARTIASSIDRCDDPKVVQAPPRYRPRFKYSPLTQVTKYDDEVDNKKPAVEAIEPVMDDPAHMPLPAIFLIDPNDRDEVWRPKRDLLDSKGLDPFFVVEVETDGSAWVRFGDDRSGLRPAEGVRFLATYRIGNGVAGNVGPDTIKHMVSSDAAFVADPGDPKILAVSNPLAARGGIEAESIEHVRQHAPAAFRRQERAVTPADYEALSVRPDVVRPCGLDVQRAAATLRWTGSWHTMFLTVDRLGGERVDADFETNLRNCLERFRMAGVDLEVDAHRPVALEIELVVCIKPGYFFSEVKEALLKVFSSRTLRDERRGVFHPDNFSFGQPVYLSAIFAAAQAVAGVDSVTVAKFQRKGIDSNEGINTGKLEVGRLEIARLDNDPTFPERGVFSVRQG